MRSLRNLRNRRNLFLVRAAGICYSGTWVMINQTRAVDKSRLVRKLGHLPGETMAEVDRALKLHCALS